MNNIYIFLDDVRDPPSDKWIVARTAEEAYAYIVAAKDDDVQITLSLDHDLGENIPTGYDLLNWLERDIATDETFRPQLAFGIHSANPVGRDNMRRAIEAILKRLEW